MDDHIYDDAKSLDSFISFTHEGSVVSGSRRDMEDQLSEDPMEDNETNVASTPHAKQNSPFHRASAPAADLRFGLEEADDLDSGPFEKNLAASARASTAQRLFDQELADCKKWGEVPLVVKTTMWSLRFNQVKVTLTKEKKMMLTQIRLKSI